MTPKNGSERGMLTRVCAGFEWLAVRLLIVMTALLIVQVGARNLFNLGLAWADELSRYCGLGIVFLAAPMLLKLGTHVRVTMFVDFLPRRLRAIADVFSHAMTTLFCVAFLSSAYLFMLRAWRFQTPAIGMPNLIFYLPALIGMTFFLLAALSELSAAFGRVVSAWKETSGD